MDPGLVTTGPVTDDTITIRPHPRATKPGTVALVTLAGLELPLNQVASIGQVVVKHISENSTAAYLYVGQSGGPWMHKLKPGEWSEGRWKLAAVHVVPDAGQCWVEYAVVSA